MNKSMIVLAGTVVLASAIPALATKPLNDYSLIRGACYGGWRGDEATVRKELGYAQRLQLNSTRIWLSPRAYRQAVVEAWKDEPGLLMWDIKHEPPTAKIQFWRARSPEKRDQAAIRKFADELGQKLKEWCNLL
jgi:hypothetical protein